MPETLNTDRYGLILSGTLAARPAAASIADKAIYVCTDEDGNPYQVYVKAGRGQDWRRILGAHTHLFADITGFLARWSVGTSYPPNVPVPSNSMTLWRYVVPAHTVSGTVVKASRCQVNLGTGPTGGNAAFVFKRNGATLATVTVQEGNTAAGEDLSPSVQLADWDVLEVVGPEYGRGARGAILQVLVSRERSA